MSRHTVKIRDTVTLPTRDEVDRAIRRRDLAELIELDRRVRDAMPRDESVSESVVREAVELLTLIGKALKRETVGLSDHGEDRARARRQRVGGASAVDDTLPARVAAARQALDGAREGRQPDADVRARADGVRRDLEGGTR